GGVAPRRGPRDCCRCATSRGARRSARGRLRGSGLGCGARAPWRADRDGAQRLDRLRNDHRVALPDGLSAEALHSWVFPCILQLFSGPSEAAPTPSRAILQDEFHPALAVVLAPRNPGRFHVTGGSLATGSDSAGKGGDADPSKTSGSADYDAQDITVL